METIGIIAAMPQERDAVLHFVKRPRQVKAGEYRCRRFTLSGRDCILITSGMGMARAARATQALWQEFHPQILVSVGVAGAVNPDLEIGDVVVSHKVCLLVDGGLGPLEPLALMSEPARQAAEKTLQGRHTRLVTGCAVTTYGTQLIGQESAELINPILEMETMGLARAATEHGIPLLSIRTISDGPRAPIPFDLGSMMDEHDNLRIGRLLGMIFSRPGLLPSLLRMGHNTKLAAQNAALTLIAVLDQPQDLIFQG